MNLTFLNHIYSTHLMLSNQQLRIACMSYFRIDFRIDFDVFLANSAGLQARRRDRGVQSKSSVHNIDDFTADGLLYPSSTKSNHLPTGETNLYSIQPSSQSRPQTRSAMKDKNPAGKNHLCPVLRKSPSRINF